MGISPSPGMEVTQLVGDDTLMIDKLSVVNNTHNMLLMVMHTILICFCCLYNDNSFNNFAIFRDRADQHYWLHIM